MYNCRSMSLNRFLQKFKFHSLNQKNNFSKGACSKPCNIEKCPPPCAPFKKILVANRGLSATRIFRACCELDIHSVAIYSECDSKQPFRLFANESYLIGKNRSPMEAYLDFNAIIKVAKRTCCDAIHPGVGYMAERSDFAEAVISAGLTFIGPSPMVLYNMGNKVCARKAAMEAGIPVVPGMDKATKNLEEIENFASELCFPVILKPAYGGGGIGLFVAHKPEDLKAAFGAVSTLAMNAFGDSSLYVEKFICKARHIEVQLLADMECNVVHLLDRDCSLQTQFKRIVSIAPAPCINDLLYCNLTEAAVSFAKHIKYQSVGSVEFLVDQEGKYYFLEVNRQLQKHHCVTEHVLGLDIVQKQIKIAEGTNLADLCIQQEKIKPCGVSVHCAVTTNDPAQNFTADQGYIQKIRYPEGIGVRVDGSGLHTGSLVSAHYGPTVMRVTTNAATFKESIARMKRSISEVRVRGVQSNIPFLLNVLECPDLVECKISTTFIEEHCLNKILSIPHDRGQNLLEFISNIVVNGPMTLVPNLNEGNFKPAKVKITPPEILENMCPDGLRQLLKEHGTYWFADYIRERRNVMLCDTTLGNAQQSLLASRLRTYDMLQIAPYISQNLCDFYALENWGGETFHTCLQHLYECPWKRIKDLRGAIPNIPFLMTIRGPSLVGYSNYPDNVVYEFCKTAVQCGIDIFRVYDPLNYLPNIELCIRAAKEAGGLVEAAVMYTGDISNPKETKYDLDYYLCTAENLINAGPHVLAIKDVAGLMRPQAAEMLVSSIRSKFCSIPIHVQTTDSTGCALACCITAAVAGADIVDVAADPMSGLTAQPNVGAVIAAFQNTDLDTGLDIKKINRYNEYWQDVRSLYMPYDCVSYVKSSSSSFKHHEIPGNQYCNLMFQAAMSGLGNRLKDVENAYHEANLVLGDIIKDMPVSKAVGDLALYMVEKGLSRSDVEERSDLLKLPESVIQYLQGFMGNPEHGYPEPWRTKALKDLPHIHGRPGDKMPAADLCRLREQLQQKHKNVCDVDVISAAVFPQYTHSYLHFKEKYSDVDKLCSRIFFFGPDMGEEFDVELSPGNVATIKLLGVSTFTNEYTERAVFFEMNGEPRFIFVKDNAEAKKRGKKKANLCIEGQIAAPKASKVLDIKVTVGDVVEKDQLLATLSTRIKEFGFLSPVSGTVIDLHVHTGSLVQEGDLMFVIDTKNKSKECSGERPQPKKLTITAT